MYQIGGSAYQLDVPLMNKDSVDLACF